MGLRLTTATAILMATTALVACGEDEDEVDAGDAVVVEDVETAEALDAEPDGDEVVVTEETVEEAADPEDLVVTEEVIDPEPDGDELVVAGEAVDPEPDGDEPILLEDADPALPESIEGVTAELETDVGSATAVDLAEEPEIVVDEVDSEAVEIVEAETETEVVQGADVALGEPELEVAEGEEEGLLEEDDGGAITLSNDVTVLDGDDLSSTEDGTDAEAVVSPLASEEVQVEETVDVATDGIDSLSELAMLDMENLVISEGEIQQLTTLVEDSEALSATQKITIVNGLDAARDNPERLAEIIEQIVTLTAVD